MIAPGTRARLRIPVGPNWTWYSTVIVLSQEPYETWRVCLVGHLYVTRAKEADLTPCDTFTTQELEGFGAAYYSDPERWWFDVYGPHELIGGEAPYAGRWAVLEEIRAVLALRANE